MEFVKSSNFTYGTIIHPIGYNVNGLVGLYTRQKRKSTIIFPKKHNLKEIRFHNLRHSCASVLLAQGVPMKQIQEWLGHSDMSTTANIYSHLDAVSKSETGAAMSKALG